MDAEIQHDTVSVATMTSATVLQKIRLAEQFRQGKQVRLLRPSYAMNLFFENSTRTHTSFEMAERRLGLQVLDFNVNSSSISKGETLEDTVKTLQAIGVDIAVIRHPANDYYQQLLDDRLEISIVNGGDGSGQHPSQSLLDMMTIYQEFGHFSGLKIGIVGDLKHSRVARSNMELLTRLGATIRFASPDEWYSAEFAKYGKRLSLDELVTQCDVVMLLRVQKERLGQSLPHFDQKRYHDQFGLTQARFKRLPPQAIIMHPAPVNRGIEIDSELVESSQSRIFKQMSNGMYMRMAILTDILVAKGLLSQKTLEGTGEFEISN
ncbi:aspartate carbamoyltransferase catalytic subunit [Fructilactobacillus florum]|uniref:Aspartate carbamoyltransferase n=1 Tax=Fructilactobacillus florum DSM 22689 = JCM 16035 TaxID=1423745 RepID=A0A0R2CLN5_9LACO|nr:aspartate carbamoyltransferase catalytic subunit [Fructilactobacillus florum]KRM92481.1 aspartate carbamoyltransferase catalytic subunit [Fructilactobacillus florum DSM 22689 = JCM 16035]